MKAGVEEESKIIPDKFKINLEQEDVRQYVDADARYK